MVYSKNNAVCFTSLRFDVNPNYHFSEKHAQITTRSKNVVMIT